MHLSLLSIAGCSITMQYQSYSATLWQLIFSHWQMEATEHPAEPAQQHIIWTKLQYFILQWSKSNWGLLL